MSWLLVISVIVVSAFMIYKTEKEENK